ncbi:MAG: ATP-binding protein [Nocardioidaceae bacterium]
MRTRTTVLACAVVALTLTAGAAGLLATLEHSLSTNRDDLSRAQLTDLAVQAADGSLPAVVADLGDNSVAQVFLETGEVLAASPGLVGEGPVLSTMPESSTPRLLTLRGVPDDLETEDYRVWVTRVEGPSGPAAVVVGASLESVEQAVSTLRGALIVGIPLLVALLALSMRVMVGRALKPVEDIRAEVATINDKALNRRVPVQGAGDEISRLADTMNGMLDRLEAASRRQQEFVADASHELQSPLAALRTQLEVSLAHPDGVEWSALATDLLADSDRMEQLVADLLFLAREDATQRAPSRDPVDLDVVVLEEATRVRARTDVSVDTSAVSGAATRGNREELSRLVRNVVENAVSHARSHVAIALAETSADIRLVVSDDGPGVPEEHRDRIFDRFARVEGSRVRGKGSTGTGLGLSIAQAIAERHGGSIFVEGTSSTACDGARFVVGLPRAV